MDNNADFFAICLDCKSLKGYMKMVGRNDKCDCGSGLKYKKCCLSKQIEKDNDKLLNPPPKTQADIVEEIRIASDKVRRRSPSLATAALLGILASSQDDVFANLR